MITKFVRNNKTILILSFFGLVIIGFPLALYGIGNSFYHSFDPDIVYITNALTYTKFKIITYADHPGTPSIMLLYYLYFPLRLMAKYVLHLPFIDWAFNNYAFLNYYSRIFELLMVVMALFIFLKAVFRNSKSKINLLITWIALISFGGLGFGISVTPENLSFLLTSVWVYFFAKFVEKRSYLINIILVIISSIAISNKFTTMFLLIPSLVLPVFIPKLKFDQRLARFETNIFIAILGFYIGILPAIDRFSYIKGWVTSLFIHSGVHATGSATIFDGKIYMQSFMSLVGTTPFMFVFTLVIIILAVGLLKKKIVKIGDPYILLLLISTVAVLVFAKYPLVHYNLTNFQLIIFSGLYFLSKVGHRVRIYCLILLTIPLTFSLKGLLSVDYLQQNINSKIIDNIVRNPTQKNVVWNNKDNMYSVLNSWTPYWSSDIFREQFKQRPILILSQDQSKIIVTTETGEVEKKTFDVCWDRLFLSEKDMAVFTKIFNDKVLDARPVRGVNLYQISSEHCENIN